MEPDPQRATEWLLSARMTVATRSPWGSGSIVSAFHSVECRKNGNFYCPECCRKNTGIVANFLHFFCKLVRIFLHYFCILILALKMDLHLFALFLHFLHPDFWGSIFQLHLFCIFLHLYLLLCFPGRGTARPHKPNTPPSSTAQ